MQITVNKKFDFTVWYKSNKQARLFIYNTKRCDKKTAYIISGELDAQGSLSTTQIILEFKLYI